MLYDGRETAAANWFERGPAWLANRMEHSYRSRPPVAESPDSDGSLRYVSAVALPNGRTRFYLKLPAPMVRTI